MWTNIFWLKQGIASAMPTRAEAGRCLQALRSAAKAALSFVENAARLKPYPDTNRTFSARSLPRYFEQLCGFLRAIARASVKLPGEPLR